MAFLTSESLNSQTRRKAGESSTLRYEKKQQRIEILCFLYDRVSKVKDNEECKYAVLVLG